MSLLGGLLGAGISLLTGRKASKAQSQAASAQAGLTRQMQETAAQRQKLYEQFGEPAYLTAIRGLLSSYGYRAPEQGVAGTSLGQPPAPAQAPTGGLLKFLAAVAKSRAAPAQAPAPLNPQGFVPGGEFGYFADLGRRMGMQTDVYDQARRAIEARSDISPAARAALLERLNRERASEAMNTMITAQREGPMALLTALAPALDMSGAVSAAQVGGQLAQSSYAQATNQLSQLAQTLSGLGELFARRPAPSAPPQPAPAPAPAPGATYPAYPAPNYMGGAPVPPVGSSIWTLTPPYQDFSLMRKYQTLGSVFGGGG